MVNRSLSGRLSQTWMGIALVVKDYIVAGFVFAG